MRLLAQVVVSLALILFVLTRLKPSQLVAAFLAADDRYLLLAFTVALVSWCLTTWKWQVLLRAVGNVSPYGRLLALNFIAVFYNNLLPGQVSGEVVKAIRVGSSERGRLAAGMSVVVDRLTWLLAALLLAIPCAALALPESGPKRLIFIGALVGAAVALGVLLLVPWQRYLAAIQVVPTRWRVRWLGAVARFAFRVVRALEAYQEQHRAVLASMSVGFLFQLSIAFADYLVAVAYHAPVTFFTMVWVVAAVLIAQSVPIAIAGLGLREGAFVVLLGQQHVPAAVALDISLSVFAMTLGMALIGGIIEAWHVVIRHARH
jgi:uncharacterized protein (TIRG00374 family)